MDFRDISKVQISYLILLGTVTLDNALLFPYVYPRLQLNAKTHGEAGDPLFLTPFLKNGSIQLARNLSLVPLSSQLGFVSHSGFFTIDETFDSNLYFWYFPPVTKAKDAPVLLWLQGGPGGTSLYGLFAEIGPITATKKGFSTRKYHWAINYHVIFVDNPVGTGFSFTNNGEGYCRDQNCISKGLYNFLQQFFTLFPTLVTNEFYIAGESYAGKYIPYLALKIHTENLICGKNQINLKGLAIGNGYCDPVNQMEYGRYLYQNGMLDDNQLQVFEKIQRRIIKEIKQQNWLAADLLVDKLLGTGLNGTSYFQMYTGFKSYYNILKSDPIDTSALVQLLDNDNVRKNIHVGGLPFNSGSKVQLHLFYDILKSVAPQISEVLLHYHTMFYNGQLDIVVAYPLTEKFLSNLNFSSANAYKNAPRYIWKVGKEIAGYFKRAGNLTEVLVRDAGHMVPRDQPKWAFDMIMRFIKNNFTET